MTDDLSECIAKALPTMMARRPGKRQVKPNASAAALLQLAFGVSDDENDEEYEMSNDREMEDEVEEEDEKKTSSVERSTVTVRLGQVVERKAPSQQAGKLDRIIAKLKRNQNAFASSSSSSIVSRDGVGGRAEATTTTARSKRKKGGVVVDDVVESEGSLSETDDDDDESDFSSSSSASGNVRSLKDAWADAVNGSSDESSDEDFRLPPDKEDAAGDVGDVAKEQRVRRSGRGRVGAVAVVEKPTKEDDDDDDESSDESFDPDRASTDRNESVDMKENEEEGGGGGGGDDSDEDDDDSDDDSDDDDDVDDDDDGPSEGMTLGELIEAMRSEKQKKGGGGGGGGGGGVDDGNNEFYCSVCLCDDSNDDDGEIMQCDNCGVTVHEACFGITDSNSEKSTDSEFSTEPWFCDACKANQKPTCQLCLGTDGLFKETDDNRWVHAVCALYTDDVKFGSVDTLSPVIISKIPANRWNSKRCELCDDEERRRKGICIRCDAGLCKSHFHVTCAQRYGFLTESPANEMVADPFFAYCKQHCVKEVARAKKKKYQAVVKRVQAFREKVSRNQDKRVLNRLMDARVYYEHLKANPKVEAIPVEEQYDDSVDPALDFRFLWTYYERKSLISKLEANLTTLQRKQKELQEEDEVLNEKGHKLTGELNDLQRDSMSLWKAGRELWQLVNSLGHEELPIPEQLENEPREAIKLDELLQQAAKQKPKRRAGDDSKQATKCQNEVSSDAKCCVCDSDDDRHLLIDCDTCLDWYHIGCIDPPMKQKPKKTSHMGWQCHFCTTRVENDSLQPRKSSADPNRVSTKRGRTVKRIEKFKFSSPTKKAKKTPSEPSQKRSLFNLFRKKKAGRKRKERTSESPGASAEATKKLKDVRTQCVKCGQSGTNQTLVRCDDCRKCYHFQCLEPPRKTTPKVAGYKWFCINCIPMSDEEVDNSWELLDKAEKMWKKHDMEDD
ncbi:PHD finger protein 14-like [Oscarella lobularis]|uniref:PHD finger protein 14-like n=1 Tax=Oscarella lobularis TaxID=121494 RepID=UPI003313D8D1